MKEMTIELLTEKPPWYKYGIIPLCYYVTQTTYYRQLFIETKYNIIQYNKNL